MKIVIIGADGQLGRDLKAALAADHPVPLDVNELDITDRQRTRDVVAGEQPAWVINCAAMTHVDRCEEEEDAAHRVNTLGARNVAEACAAVGARLVHISTDYVFDGRKKKPYEETDPTAPLNVYGITKLAGELYVTNRCPDHYIVRTSGLYGTNPCIGKGGANFVEKMMQLAGEREVISVVDDEVLTPTFTEDLAAQVLKLIEAVPNRGIYHATNDGECSWYDFAAEVFRVTGTTVRLEKTSAAEWKAPAVRPAYSVLENAALKRAGIDCMPHWKDALARYHQRKTGG